MGSENMMDRANERAESIDISKNSTDKNLTFGDAKKIWDMARYLAINYKGKKTSEQLFNEYITNLR